MKTSAVSRRKFWPTPQAQDCKQNGLRPHSRAKMLISEVLTSYAADSPAKTFPSPARVLVLQARGVGSGANTTDSFASFDPATSSWRTSQRCLVEGWAKYSETWPRSGMTRSGTAYRLPTLAPLTDGTESGLFHTPTETANQLSPSMMKWPGARRLWPTPDTHMGHHGGQSYNGAVRRAQIGKQVDLRDAVVIHHGSGGSLNPTWVEWLMGFPLGWTVLERWVTRSSRKLSKSSYEQS